MNHDGFVKIYRRIKNDWKWKTPLYRSAWVSMLIDAKWSENHGLDRGQLLISVRQAAKEWGMSTTHTYRFLQKCVSENDISLVVVDRKTLCSVGTKEGTKEGTQRGTLGRFTALLVTILNYERDQGMVSGPDGEEGTKDGTKGGRSDGTSYKNKKEVQRKEQKSMPSPQGNGVTNPDSRIKWLIDFFHDEHLKMKGEKPHIFAKDAKAIQRLLTTYRDEDEIKRRMLLYLQDPLSWMNNPQWTITAFEKFVQKYSVNYLAKKITKPPSEEFLENE